MNEIEEKITQLVNNKVEEVLKRLADHTLRIRIHEQAKNIIQGADFSEHLRPRIELLHRESWFVDKLTETVQSVLDDSLLEHIEERVEANLNGDGVESRIIAKIPVLIEESFAHSSVQGCINQAIFKFVERQLNSELVSSYIESLIQTVFQKSLDNFANKMISKSPEGR